MNIDLFIQLKLDLSQYELFWSQYHRIYCISKNKIYQLIAI